MDISNLSNGAHIQSIYKNIEEQFLLTIPFFKMGLAKNEKCVFIADPTLFPKITKELGQYVDLEQLILLDSKSIYLGNKTLDANYALSAINEIEEKALQDGFTSLRISGELPATYSDTIDYDSLFNYEATADNYLKKSKNMAICNINESKFKPEFIAKLLKTHYYVGIYGKLYENKYFYTSPEYIHSNKSEYVASDYKNILNTIMEG